VEILTRHHVRPGYGIQGDIFPGALDWRISHAMWTKFCGRTQKDDMMPGQYLHMPPPLPVKGLPVDEDDGRTLSSARQRRTPRWDLRMESMEGG